MPDLSFVRHWFARYWLAVWFATIFFMRLSALVLGNVGFDARLYLAATRAWLTGSEPWISIQQQQFAAPPPSLLPLVPFAWLPEDVGAAVLMAVAVVGVIATVRLLHLPWWWLFFPPFLDAAFNGNPQAVLVPLILVGAGSIAAFLKIYALVPIILGLRWRSLLVTVAALVLTAPILPWASYLAHASEISASLVRQTGGGMSATVIPWSIPIAALLLVLCGRERAAWMAVPVIWPSTQFYYSTLAVPALGGMSIAAAIMAVPVQGAPVIAAGVMAWQARNFTVARLREAWIPSKGWRSSQLTGDTSTHPSPSS
ncbi:MAG TPA: hypothetical protein VGQ89_10340 [Candidatus Limnocylindrales bacterium]|nr:hypothetical protein [Candidatus Limnocylindrales bacterium]